MKALKSLSHKQKSPWSWSTGSRKEDGCSSLGEQGPWVLCWRLHVNLILQTDVERRGRLAKGFGSWETTWQGFSGFSFYFKYPRLRARENCSQHTRVQTKSARRKACPLWPEHQEKDSLTDKKLLDSNTRGIRPLPPCCPPCPLEFLIFH